MKPLKEIAESLTVAAVMLLVLLPVRVLFVRYVADDWIGSFGLITIISFSILYFSYKNKLGWFGKAFVRQLFKVNKGKRKYFVYFNLLFGLMYFSSIVYGVEISNQFEEDKTEIQNEININSLQQLEERVKEEVDWKQLPLAILTFFYIMIFRFDVYALLVGTLNDISDGYFLHFSTVFMVEIIEVLGILIFSKYWLKNKQISFK